MPGNVGKSCHLVKCHRYESLQIILKLFKYFATIKRNYRNSDRMACNSNNRKLLNGLCLDDNTVNGLYFNNKFVPEEILCLILSFADDRNILKYTTVCKKWHNVIKSYTFWCSKYKRKYGRKAKKLPWYLYYCLFVHNFFESNLIRNGCGEEGFNHWNILKNYGDEFKIENTPNGADPLPLDVADFNGKTSCFATSYFECSKEQTIELNNVKLYSHILDVHKPHIYVSEWVAGRFDCACEYKMQCSLMSKNDKALKKVTASFEIKQWEGKAWNKVCMSCGICSIFLKITILD